MENNLLESQIKVREGKKWKSRWCVLKKVSPVADCLHLYVYKEPSSNKKQPKEKAAHILDNYCGLESGYRVDKEHYVLAILCVRQVLLLAFDCRHSLQEWINFVRDKLGHENTFQATLIQSPSDAKLSQRPVRIFVTSKRLSLVAHIPPVIQISWLLSDIRSFGVVAAGTFCIEGGSRAGKGHGLFAFLTDHGKEIDRLLKCSNSQQTPQTLSRRQTHTGCITSSISPIELAQSRRSVFLTTPSPSPLAPHSPVFTFPSPSSSLSHATDWHHSSTVEDSSQRPTHSKAEDPTGRPLQLSPTPVGRHKVSQSKVEDRWKAIQPKPEDTVSLFSSFGDLGVNSEVKRCLQSQQGHHSRNSVYSVRGESVQRSGSADILDRHSSRSSLVDNSKSENEAILDRSLRLGTHCGYVSSPKRLTSHNLPIIHGHSRSVGCDGSENYMDFSDILKSKAKDSRRKRQSSACSSTYTSQNRLDKISSYNQATIQHSTDSVDSHAYANDVFINQVTQGSQDLLSEILSECQLQDSQFHKSSPGGASGQNGRTIYANATECTSQESHVAKSESHSSHTKENKVAPPLIKPLKQSTKEHSYVNFQPGQKQCQEDIAPKSFDQKTFPLLHNLLKGFTGSVTQKKPETVITEVPEKPQKDHVTECSAIQKTALNKRHKKVDKKEENKRQEGVCRYTICRSASLPELCRSDITSDVLNQDGSLGQANLGNMTQPGGNDGPGKNKGSSHNKKKSHQQKKRQSRSLPEFDPLRPLEFVDLSRYDGKDEGYLYWLKAGPNSETQSDRPDHGYDNVTENTEVSYVNVNMKSLKELGQAPALGYDNVPSQGTDQSKNYDNLLGDNRTDSAKATVEYENFPQAKAQTVASSNYYQNLPKSKKSVVPTGANTYSSSKNDVCDVRSKQFYANIPPESAEKSKAAKKKKKGSHLPFGGTFAIHGSLRRSKPNKKDPGMQVNSEAGDIAGSYVKLKGSSVEQGQGSPSHLGVTNLAHAMNRLEGVGTNGLVDDENVELVILEMSDDDPQRDNIANMLVEQGRPLIPRGRPLYGRTGPPQPLPPRRFSIHNVPSDNNKSTCYNSDCQTSPRNHSAKTLSTKSAFQPVGRKSTLSKSRSSSPLVILDGHPEGDTYGSYKEKHENMQEKRGRDSEYIDMSQPLRPLADDLHMSTAHTVPLVHGSRSRNNSSSSTLSQCSSQDQPRDSPYMDMSFMKHKHQSKSPLATPERKKLSSPKSSPLLHADRLCMFSQHTENSSPVIHRRLQHSKSLDNDLEDMYYGSDTNDVLVTDTVKTGGNASHQYLPMSTINRHIHQTDSSKSSKTGGGDCNQLIRRSHSENDQDKPLKPFDGLLDLPCYTEPKVSPKKLMDANHSSGTCTTKGHAVEEDNVSTTSSSGSSGTMPRRGSKGFLARLMRKNSSAKDLAKISKSQEDILEVESETVTASSLTNGIKPEVPPRAGGAAEHIYAQIPEQMPELNDSTSHNIENSLRDPVTLPLRKKVFHETPETCLLDPVIRKEMTNMLQHTTTGRVCLEHGNLTDEQKQSCASLLSGRSMTPPTPPPNIPLPPPPRKVMNNKELTLSSTPPAPPVPSKTYRKNKKIPPPLPQHLKAEPEYVDIDDDDFPRGTGRETLRQGLPEQQQGQRQMRGAENFSHLGFLEDGRPVPPPRPVSTLSPNSSRLCYEAEDCCEIAAPKPHQIVQRSVSLRANPVSLTTTPPPLCHRGVATLPHQRRPGVTTETTRYVPGPSGASATTMLRPRSAREYHHIVDRKRLLGDDCPSSGASSGSQTPASTSSQSSPTKSPSSLQANVFNFDPQNVKKVQKQAGGGSDADSPLGFRDPDHVYMNLSFPKSPGRSGSPVVVDSSHRAAIGNTPDYANVVLNYAEIDLSRCKDSSGKKRSEKTLQKSNIDYAMIDMVATAAVSRAGKEHMRHREEESLRHQRQLRRNEQSSEQNSKENQRKGKERKSGGTTGGATGKSNEKDKKLGRSNSSISRSSGNSADRKSSLPA